MTATKIVELPRSAVQGLTSQGLTDEQRRNARRIMRQMLRDTLNKQVSLSELPDVGPLHAAYTDLLEGYKEAGSTGVSSIINAIKDDYPVLSSLAQKNKYEPMKLSELLKLPPQEWIITNIFYEEAISVFYGLPGDGKSFLVLDMMCHIALGRAWQGRKVKQCRVFYLAGEGERGYQRRMNAWCSHFRVKPEHLEPFIEFIGIPLPLSDASEVAEYIDAVIDAVQDAQEQYNDNLPLILVLDTLFQCSSGKELNNAAVVTELISSAQSIRAKTNATQFVLVHHSGKDVERGMNGSIALKASTDIVYRVKSDNEGLMTVVTEKIKDAENTTFYVKRMRVEYGATPYDNSCVVVPAEKPETGPKLLPSQQKILAVLPSGAPGIGFEDALNAIREKDGKKDGKGMSQTTLSTNLKKLEENKLVIHLEEGGYYKIEDAIARMNEGSEDE